MEKQDTIIAVFARTPTPTARLKTRLAKTVGQEAATAIYTESLKTLLTTLQQLEPLCDRVITLAEEEHLTHPFWNGESTMFSGGSSLGECLHHTYTTLYNRYKNVILIGSDSPQLSPHIFTQAMTALNDNALVIGPACDGGFYLFGGNIPLPPSFWLSPTYSQPDTLKQLLSKQDYRYILLQEEPDFDQLEDLEIVTQRMQYSTLKQHRHFIQCYEQLLPPSTQN